MPERIIQRANPAPYIHFIEIVLPDDSDWGTGTSSFVTEPHAGVAHRVTTASFLKRSIFQINAVIDPQASSLNVTLGVADTPLDLPRKSFILPGTISDAIAHTVRIEFAAWTIFAAQFDGVQLREHGVAQAH